MNIGYSFFKVRRLNREMTDFLRHGASPLLLPTKMSLPLENTEFFTIAENCGTVRKNYVTLGKYERKQYNKRVTLPLDMGTSQ